MFGRVLLIHKLRIALIIAVFISPLTVTSGLAAEAGKTDKTETEVFAKVGDTVITLLDYQFAFGRAAREKFYHGTPAQGLIAALQREVGKQLVEDALLVKEAKRRGIKADASFVEKQIKELVEKNKENPQWEKEGEIIILQVKTFLEEQEMLKRLKKVVIDEIPNPTEAVVRTYYEENSQFFTEPEKMRVWLILLKVDPGAGSRAWDAARQRATKIISRLKKGEDFEMLAKQQSDDYTRENGGDMGFIHKGVLAGKAQAEAERLNPGEFSGEPILLLEGYAIIKRGGLILPKRHKFDDVKDRAGRLLKRDLEKTTWENLKVKLRKGVPVEVNDTIYAPLADQTGKNKVEDGHK